MPSTKTPEKKGRECYHCHRWIRENEAHDCWTTTEEALTRDLSEDLRDAWERLRETAAEFGAQRIYASHKSIMFSRKVCYFFVRPTRKVLEVWFFLGRAIKSPVVRKTMSTSKVKIAHLAHVTHRDQVEAPLTDWLREAYDTSERLRVKVKTRGKARKTASKTKGRNAAESAG